MQTNKPTLIFHIEKYSGPFQVIINKSVGYCDLVWSTLIKQNGVLPLCPSNTSQHNKIINIVSIWSSTIWWG